MKVYVAVEGKSDQGVATAILRECDMGVENFFGLKGKPYLLRKLPSYNQSANIMPWFALVDLGDQISCVKDARLTWLANPNPFMRFRIAVVEAEAWLLADPESISKFLGVSASLIPTNPESLKNPKQTVVNLARKSRNRNIREGLVPREGSGTNVGPTYSSDISNFAETAWRPRIAAESAPSLNRCLSRLRELRAEYRE